jgi:hypothetical protein
MRLIDADALRASAIKATGNSVLTFDNCFPYWQFSKCINEAPTIDAVPVVRCKECGHYDTTGYPALNPGTGWCDKMGKGVHDDFYCSYGERKESEGQHMNDRRISNLQWAMSVLEELPTETIEQDRAISIGVAAIRDKIDSLCEQEDKP